MGTAGPIVIKFADGQTEDLILDTAECTTVELIEKARLPATSRVGSQLKQRNLYSLYKQFGLRTRPHRPKRDERCASCFVRTVHAP